MASPFAIQVVVYPQTTSHIAPPSHISTPTQQPSAVPVSSPHAPPLKLASPNAAESPRCCFENEHTTCHTNRPPPLSPWHTSMAPPPSSAPFPYQPVFYVYPPGGTSMPPPSINTPTPVIPGSFLPHTDWTQVPPWMCPAAPPPMPPPPVPQINLLLSADSGHASRVVLDLSSHAYEPHKHATGWFPSTHLAHDELSQPATYPAITRMVFVCAEIPDWRVVLESPSNVAFLSVHDVLSKVHQMLHRQITHADWHKLSDERAEEVARAYTRRTRALAATAAYEGSKLQGVKWVDYLEDAYIFGGFVCERGEQGVEHFRLVVRKD